VKKDSRREKGKKGKPWRQKKNEGKKDKQREKE
jgi:hypothetical protein